VVFTIFFRRSDHFSRTAAVDLTLGDCLRCAQRWQIYD
jgi:hypothetical protein